MARIPDEELERIKRETDLVALVEASGVVPSRHGADLLGLCPFHDDREPSLVVSPRKNLWHCLGACRAGGSVIDWVMRREGVSFRHAVEILRRGRPAEVSSSTSSPTPPPARHLPAVLEPDAEDAALLRQVVDYYHETLKGSPEAMAYLEKRGLAHPELVGRFRLGYANRTLGYRLPPKRLKAGEEVRGRLQRLGILRERGHEHFRGSLVVPVFGEGGEVLEIYGRKTSERLRRGTPAHLYLPGPHRGVWNRDALAGSSEVILTESLIDAMTFWCAGLRNVTAAYGVNGFTDEHLEAFRACGVRRVLIAYDRDSAGDQAAAALVPVLSAAGIASARIQFPRGLDANAYALEVQPASKSLAVLIEQAGWLADAAEPDAAACDDEAAKEESAPPSLAAVAADAEPSAGPEPAIARAPAAAAPRADAAAAVRSDVLSEVPHEVDGDEVWLTLGDRSYRVRGLSKNTTPDALRVNLLVRRGEGLHVDTLDLYAARQRGAYAAQAASELGLKDAAVKKDLGRVLLALEVLHADVAAVRAAIALPWSNGPVEGQVNRLKMLKRQMFGRANFDLLRERVLHAA